MLHIENNRVAAGEYSLDGKWEVGEDRVYTACAAVPGLATDPGEINKGTLWYRKELTFPEGTWTHATLILNGARFCPAVYVNGKKVSECGGGMTVTTHSLNDPHVVPGGKIILEIALRSLKDVDETDASRIPDADLWRSNVSSCLWDSVTLSLHGPVRIKRLIPFYDAANQEVAVYWEAEQRERYNGKLHLEFQALEDDGCVAAGAKAESTAFAGKVRLDFVRHLRLWSHETPNFYKLRVRMKSEQGVLFEQTEMTLGVKDFRTDGIKFRMNGNPVTLRAGSVVWHRWLRDPEARELAFDTRWFEKNILQRLKSHGANTIRFHLGVPPEAILDLCDKLGMMVQIEWLFFHGMNASLESLIEQWRNWLDLCMRHPCVCLFHAWNETSGDSLQIAYRALDILTREYPPLVVGHRDVLHTHKYWWSLFENVGLYFDSAEQFGKPVMADEFGGNYLDREGNPGAYPAVKGSLLRFLGWNHTKETRLELHRKSNTQIAEYWRRLGVAGFSPFCILGSPQDGNSHFLGNIEEANPMPVWDGLTAAYSPVSCSLEVWDRNFLPGQLVNLPLYLFNDTAEDSRLQVEVRIVCAGNPRQPIIRKTEVCEITAFGRAVKTVSMSLPNEEGGYCFEAELLNPPEEIKHPVVSRWDFSTMNVRVPKTIEEVSIGVPESEQELVDFLRHYQLNVCKPDDPKASVILASAKTWDKLSDDGSLIKLLEQRMEQGCSVILLDAGPKELGQGYLPEKGVAMLDDTFRLQSPEPVESELPFGIKVLFKGLPEPESCIHPAKDNDSLWADMDLQSTWFWNGLRGGLILPTRDMEFDCLNPLALVALWEGRGADPAAMRSNTSYFAYELAGFYAYSAENEEMPSGKKVMEELRAKVRFLVEDAPSLQNVIDPNAAIKVYNLAKLYRQNSGGRVTRLIPLASAGKNLTRTPAVMIELEKNRGRLLVSQILTQGRLAPGYGQNGLYGIRHDPAACQMVLNMIKTVLE